MIDSHCHLDHEPLYENLSDVVNRAENNGVKLMLTISTNLESFDRIKLIISKFKNIFGTFGIHPHETKIHSNINKEKIISIQKKYNKIIGIGETGLDYYYNNSDKVIQKKLFIEHIKASLELNLPIIVHSRSAEDDTYGILNDFSSQNPKILMHCFTGSKAFSEKLLKLNAFFSFSGIITFNNSRDLQSTASSIPLNKILIETDSPFLAPEPKRGKKNEPSFIIHTAKKLAEIKNLSLEDISRLTSNNFSQLFSIKI